LPPTVVNANAFQDCPLSRTLGFIDANGEDLTGAALTTAQNNYKAVNDGDTSDTLWYGWYITKADGLVLTGVTSDDTANTMTGMTAAMEFSTDGTNWTAYNAETPNLPDLTGTVALQVIVAETTTHNAGPATTFNFTVPITYNVTFVGGAEATGTAPTQGATAAGSTFVLPANPFTRTGYTFASWSDGTNTYNAGATYTMPANAVTFTAQWTENAPNTHSVSGTITDSNGNPVSGATVTLTIQPTTARSTQG
jgi:uncharacterized repeat protein (TIGR02543 family)